MSSYVYLYEKNLMVFKIWLMTLLDLCVLIDRFNSLVKHISMFSTPQLRMLFRIPRQNLILSVFFLTRMPRTPHLPSIYVNGYVYVPIILLPSTRLMVLSDLDRL